MAKKRKQFLFEVFLFLFVSCIFTFIHSSSISPFLNKVCDGTDSTMFQVIGKGWLEGKIPYVDLWDSKGPLIFFINMLGYALTGSRTGIFIINIISWAFTIFFTDKIVSLEYKKPKSYILSVIFCFAYSMYIGKTGNTVTTYTLPMSIFSIYLMILYFDGLSKGKESHDPRYAFVYGISFAICFLTRLTDSVPVCCIVAVITVYLIIKKNWKNLLNNMLMFILGVLVMCMPFVIYFASKDALYNFIYGTILYNISYLGEKTRVLDFSNILNIIRIPLALLSSALMMFVGLFLTKNRDTRCKGVLYLFIAVVSSLYFLKSVMFIHYSTIMVPYFAVCLVELKRMTCGFKSSIPTGFWKFVLYALISVNTVFAVCGCAYNLYLQQWGPSEIPLKEEIPESDLNSFAAYNVDSRVYLELDCMPCYKYFAYQDWAEGCTEKTIDEIRELYMSRKAKWILYREDGECLIDDILDEYYECADSEGSYQLYKLK